MVIAKLNIVDTKPHNHALSTTPAIKNNRGVSSMICVVIHDRSRVTTIINVGTPNLYTSEFATLCLSIELFLVILITTNNSLRK